MAAVAASAQPVPSVWIDTSVALEIYTQGDLFREIDRLERCSLLGSNARIEYRRMRAQGSWWMAMALRKHRVTTVVSKHETLNAMVERLAPPGSDPGVWTAAIGWVLESHGMFEGWTRRADQDGEHLSDRGMDRLIVEKARDHKLILITRDVEIIEKKGPRLGVTPVEPEAYARAMISREEARAMFLARLDAAATAWVSLESVTLDRIGAMRVLRDKYEWIWEPDGVPNALESSSSLGARVLGEPLFARWPGRP